MAQFGILIHGGLPTCSKHINGCLCLYFFDSIAVSFFFFLNNCLKLICWSPCWSLIASVLVQSICFGLMNWATPVLQYCQRTDFEHFNNKKTYESSANNRFLSVKKSMKLSSHWGLDKSIVFCRCPKNVDEVVAFHWTSHIKDFINIQSPFSASSHIH